MEQSGVRRVEVPQAGPDQADAELDIVVCDRKALVETADLSCAFAREETIVRALRSATTKLRIISWVRVCRFWEATGTGSLRYRIL